MAVTIVVMAAAAAAAALVVSWVVVVVGVMVVGGWGGLPGPSCACALHRRGYCLVEASSAAK